MMKRNLKETLKSTGFTKENSKRILKRSDSNRKSYK